MVCVILSVENLSVSVLFLAELSYHSLVLFFYLSVTYVLYLNTGALAFLHIPVAFSLSGML